MENKVHLQKRFHGHDIPQKWVVKRFDAVCEKILDGTHFSPKSNNGPFKYLTSKNIRNEGIDLSNVSYISELEHQEIYKKCPVKTGDILLTKDGAGTGACCVNTLSEEFSLLSSVALLRGNNNILNSDFLLQFIKGPTGQKIIQDAISGQAITRITLEKIKGFKILLPELHEQDIIAKILSVWDTAISKTQELIKKKELQKKWLMQQLLSGKKRLKGFEGAWEEASLGEVFERVTRKNTEGNTNVVTISAQRGFVKQTDFFKKNIASEIVDNYFLVHRDEFCYNKSYSNGYPWGATKRLNDFDKAVVTTLYICFGIKDQTKNSGDFFEHFFDANLLDKGLMQIAHEGGRAHGLLNVTPSDFFNIKISVPTQDEQLAIASVLDHSRKEINLLNSTVDTLKDQKKGLMQVLLTGKKRLKVADLNTVENGL